MSTAHNRATTDPVHVEVGIVPLAAEGSTTFGSDAGARRHERRRTGGLHSIGKRLADRSAALEARLFQERQRVAAEIHDLVMQDVSFALGRARAIASDPALAADHAEAAVMAGERALAGARAIVRGLAERDTRPVAELLEESVRAAARDVQLKLEISVSPQARSDQATSDALVHIGREAVTNAVKHADPQNVSVQLTREDEWCLRVSDDGRGFDPVSKQAGFGLQSIRRQVRSLGGSLSITSVAERGTVIEVFLP